MPSVTLTSGWGTGQVLPVLVAIISLTSIVLLGAGTCVTSAMLSRGALMRR